MHSLSSENKNSLKLPDTSMCQGAFLYILKENTKHYPVFSFP